MMSLKKYGHLAVGLVALTGGWICANEQESAAVVVVAPKAQPVLIAAHEKSNGMQSGKKEMAPDTNHRLFDPQALKKDCGVWVTGDVLLWKASEDDLDFAVKSSSRTLVKGHVVEPEFEWDWGFRLGLGYKLPHDQWDLYLNYTYVHGDAHKHVGAGDGAIYGSYAAFFGIYPLPVPPATFYEDSAHSHWNMNLNMADLELGRNMIASKWLSLRPFIGLRGLVIQQDYNISYHGGSAFLSDTQKVGMTNDYWGVGLRMGLDTLWGLGHGFSIYGNGAAALLSGTFDVHQKNHMEKENLTRMNIHDDDHWNVVATAELALGLQWDHFFHQDRYHFGVNLGWEFNAFFNQNRIMRFLSMQNPGAFTRSNGDLTFQGLPLDCVLISKNQFF